MSSTRLTFIIVSIVVGLIVFTLGVIVQKNGGGGVVSIKSLFDPVARAERKSRPVTPKSLSSYLTIVLVGVIVVMLLVFSRR